LSLLVDNFALPTEGFLTPTEQDNEAIAGEVVVHPWSDDQLQNAVSIPVSTLALLTKELVLPVENSELNGVDILDIPTPAPQEGHPLWNSKCRWLLESYRQQLQPDVLLICNATAHRSTTTATAKALLNWVKETQSGHETALPGLVWTITPHDARFTSGQNLDEVVQQLVGKPGQHWGTLQALDASSLQRVLEWLAQATAPALRQHRFKSLRERHQLALRDLMQAWLIAPQKRMPLSVPAQKRSCVSCRPMRRVMASCWKACCRICSNLTLCGRFSNRAKNRSAACLTMPSTCLARRQRAANSLKWRVMRANRRTRCGSTTCVSGVVMMRTPPGLASRPPRCGRWRKSSSSVATD
jgi:hypothetical protein